MFQRAKSEENKKIRMKEIMVRADSLFQTQNYHDITLTTIAKELGITRTALYKYVSSKEEIFLDIIIEKQKQVYDEIVNLLTLQEKTVNNLAYCITDVLYNHVDFIKYFQILTSIVETNVSIDCLVKFKTRSNQDSKQLYQLIEEITGFNQTEVFHLYLKILYHTIYLSDVAFPNKKYYEAMKIAKLPIATLDFKNELINFIHMLCVKK